MREEGDKLNRAFERSRSRLIYLNIALVVEVVLASVIEIFIIVVHK